MAGTEAADASPPVDDSGLRCLTCDYNLTGVAENRCPECGTEFDPEVLRRIAAGEPIPCTPWDTRGGLAGFWRTWTMSLCTPWRLADNFAPRHDAGRAVVYSWACYALAWFLFLGLGTVVFVFLAPSDAPLFFLFGVLATLSVIPAWLLCETLIAGVLTLFLKPAGARDRYHFWRGLTHYASGFTVLTMLWIALGVVELSRSVAYEMPMRIGAGLIFLWWVVALWIMVLRRTSSFARSLFAALVIPAVGIAMIFLGAFVPLITRLLW